MPRRISFDLDELRALDAMLENGEHSDCPEFWVPLLCKVKRALAAELASSSSHLEANSVIGSLRRVEQDAAETRSGGGST